MIGLIQLLGLILSVYAVCRLMQAPASIPETNKKDRLQVSVVSFIGVIAIVILAYNLVHDARQIGNQIDAIGNRNR